MQRKVNLLREVFASLRTAAKLLLRLVVLPGVSNCKLFCQAFEVILALRRTFESLIGSLPKHQEMRPMTIPYPLEAAEAQINTMLDMAVTMLKIEQICRIRRK